jgi:hypothetical protein
MTSPQIMVLCSNAELRAQMVKVSRLTTQQKEEVEK